MKRSRWFSSLSGVPVGFGVVQIVTGSLTLGLVTVALGAALIAAECIADSWRFQQRRLDRRRARCDHDFVGAARSLDRCRHCGGLQFSPEPTP